MPQRFFNGSPARIKNCPNFKIFKWKAKVQLRNNSICETSGTKSINPFFPTPSLPLPYPPPPTPNPGRNSACCSYFSLQTLKLWLLDPNPLLNNSSHWQLLPVTVIYGLGIEISWDHLISNNNVGKDRELQGFMEIKSTFRVK